MFEEYRDKGVHFFAVEGDGLTKEENMAIMGEWEYTVPTVTLADSNLNGYDMVTMPAIYVINGFGRVVFQGTGDYEKYIESAIEDVPYPGLGKKKVHEDCEKAAEEFGAGDYTAAIEEANKVLKGEGGDEAKEDAQYIIDRANELGESWRAKVDEATESGRYQTAIEYLEKLEESFGDDERGEKAEKELKKLKKNDKAKDELKARKALTKTLAANKKSPKKADKLSNLYAFYEKYEGTASAKDAKAMAQAIKDSRYWRE